MTRNAFQGPIFEALRPEDLIDWSYLWHVNGFIAQVTFALSGNTDGNPAANLGAELGGKTLTQATESLQPIYRTTGGVNGRAALEGRDVTNGLLQVAFGSALPQPYSIVELGQFPNDPGADATITDGVATQVLTRYESAAAPGNWELRAGATLTGPTVLGVTSPQLVVYHAAGASSYVEVNNSGRVTGNAGTNSLDGITAYNNRTGNAPSDFRLSFLGVYPGDVTTDDNWETFLRWVEAYYELDMNL